MAALCKGRQMCLPLVRATKAERKLQERLRGLRGKRRCTTKSTWLAGSSSLKSALSSWSHEVQRNSSCRLSEVGSREILVSLEGGGRCLEKDETITVSKAEP